MNKQINNLVNLVDFKNTIYGLSTTNVYRFNFSDFYFM